MRSKIFYVFFILIACNPSYSQPEKAIEYYNQKNYKEALIEWNIILDQGAKGEELYYNIGNTYYQLHQYPEAILFFCKALKWNPECLECKQNLKLAQKKGGVESFDLPHFFLTPLYHSMLLRLQPIGWFISGIVIFCIFLFIVLFKRNSKLVVIYRGAIFLLMILGSICLVFAWQRDQIKHGNDEVILMHASGLYQSPDENSESKQELIPGQMLKIKDQLNLSGWIKVQTKEFDLGWVEKNKIVVVSL